MVTCRDYLDGSTHYHIVGRVLVDLGRSGFVEDEEGEGEVGSEVFEGVWLFAQDVFDYLDPHCSHY